MVVIWGSAFPVARIASAEAWATQKINPIRRDCPFHDTFP
jgi:hypothetical protein